MRRFLSAAMLSLMAVSLPASASVITFSDRSAFDAATGPQRSIDFERYEVGPLCPSAGTTEPCQWRAEGITFVSAVAGVLGQGPLLSIIDMAMPASHALLSSALPAGPDDFYWRFTARYMGFDVFTYGTYVVTLTDLFGSAYEFRANSPTGKTFFGLLSDTPVRRLSIYADCSPGECWNVTIDNLAFGAVPEPPIGLLLFGPAIAFLSIARRHRHEKVSSGAPNRLKAASRRQAPSRLPPRLAAKPAPRVTAEKNARGATPAHLLETALRLFEPEG